MLPDHLDLYDTNQRSQPEMPPPYDEQITQCLCRFLDKINSARQILNE